MGILYFERLFLLLLSFGTTGMAECFESSYCGFGKNCVVKPAGCLAIGIENCTHGVSFRPVGDGELEIELFWNTEATQDIWMAVAFSEACHGPCMANTAVSECSALKNQAMTAKLSYNNEKPTNTRIDNAEELAAQVLKGETYSANGKQVYCRYRQKILGVSQLLQGKPNSEKVFSAEKTKKYMVLTAVGPTNYTFIQHHDSITLTKAVYDLFGDVNPLVTVATPKVLHFNKWKDLDDGSTMYLYAHQTNSSLTGVHRMNDCKICSMLFDLSIHHFNTAKPTKDQLRDQLDQECRVLGDREGIDVGKKCEDYCNKYIDKIYKDLETDGMSPEKSCTDLGICN